MSLERKNNLLISLNVIFVGILMLSGPMAVKLIQIGPFVAPVAVFMYSITYLITDFISEMWGKKEANQTVILGMLGFALGGIMSVVATSIPGIDPYINSSFSAVFGGSVRIYIASFLSFLVSQSHDVFTFHWLKDKTSGKHLWLRNNLSTIGSQLIDTTVFVTIAFFGCGLPIGNIIIGQFLIKVVIALLDTPILYAVVFKSRKLWGL